MELQLPIFFTVVLVLFMVVKRFKSKNTTSKLPPGPWKLPLIGHLHHLVGFLPHRTLWDLSKKHGPLMYLQFGEVSTIVVSSPSIAKVVLKTNEDVFADRPSVFAMMMVTYGGKGIIFAQFGGVWKQLRKIWVLEFLSAKKIQSFKLVIDEKLKILQKEISISAGSPVNLSRKLFCLNNDLMSRAAFGNNCIEEATVLSLVEQVVELATGFAVEDIFPSFKCFHGISGAMRNLKKMHGKIDSILEDIITDRKIKRKMNNSTKCNVAGNLVDVLLSFQEDNHLEFPIENDSIKAAIFEIFLAGTETSLTTIEWAMAEMLRNPSIMEKAQSEVRSVFDGQQQLAGSDMNELTYLKLIIKESFRLHPAAALLAHRESRERCEINGYEIPKGTKLIVNTWAMGRDPENWSDAETFKPERFQDISVDYKGTNFEFLPFGAGKRICPGIALAEVVVEFTLAQLLYHFDWALPNGLNPEEVDMTEHFGVTVSRKADLYLIPIPYHP